MEEKELQTGEIKEPHTADTAELQPVEEQNFSAEMRASEIPGAGSPMGEEQLNAGSARPEESNVARERLREAVQQSKAKVSNFMRPSGLFEEYEITNAKQLPFFMRVFAASALLHLVIFATAMQLPAVVETTCETTEFTQRLCDTMYVASLVRPDRTWVDQEVTDPTVIPDAVNPEDVTMIAEADFQYPEGYWTLRDEIEGRVADETVTPAIDGNTFTFGNSNNTVNSPAPPPEIDLSKPQKLPKQNKGAVTGGDIDSVFKTSPGPQPPLGGGGRKITDSGTNKNPVGIPDPKANSNSNTTAQNPKPANPLPEDAYNKKRLYEFRDLLVKSREVEQLNLYQQFQYSVSGIIDKDGKLIVAGAPTFTGDPKMQDLIKAAVESFSDSGLLKAVKDLQSKSVKITIAQDGNQFLVRLETQQNTEKDARSLYNGLTLALDVAKTFVAAGAEEEADPTNKQKELTTLELIKMAQLKRDGTNIIVDFLPPNKFVEDMYQTYKKDLEEKKTNPSSPEGIAANSNKDLGTSK